MIRRKNLSPISAFHEGNIPVNRIHGFVFTDPLAQNKPNCPIMRDRCGYGITDSHRGGLYLLIRRYILFMASVTRGS
jgi:hypothetical protein